MALRYVLKLGAAITGGELELREIIERPEGDEKERDEALDPKPFLKTVAKLRRLGAKLEELRRQLKRIRLSKQRRATLEHKEIVLTQRICRLLADLNLSASRIDDMTQSLKRSADRVTALEQRLSELPKRNQTELLGQIREIEQKVGISANQMKATLGRSVKAKLCSAKPRRSLSKPIFAWWLASPKNM